MRALIAVLPGDGIGPEVTAEARRALEAVARLGGHDWDFAEALVGGAAIDATGNPLPAETLALCRRADAILFGAVGGPKWSDPSLEVRPERGLLALRRELGLFANLRPVKVHPGLVAASPIREDIARGTDLLIVRELTGGLYFGERGRTEDRAWDVCEYRTDEIERAVRVAARLAASRRGKVTSVDKANVLETSRLWRSVTGRVVEAEFPSIELEHLLVDAAAMHLMTHPRDFDVIVTENLFGDILSDEASVLCASIGMLPSASLGADGRGLYEPIHGSAPDIARRGVANPLGAIRSAALLLRHSLGLEAEARALEQAVDDALEAGLRTADVAGAGERVSTSEIGAAVCERIGGG